MPLIAGANVGVLSAVAVGLAWIPGVGGTPPPAPITTGDGRAFPDDTRAMVGEPISVVVRLLVPVAPPGRNSCTVPDTSTASPTATVGAADVKTNTASDVAGSASGVGSWR